MYVRAWVEHVNILMHERQISSSSAYVKCVHPLLTRGYALPCTTPIIPRSSVSCSTSCTCRTSNP